LVLNLLSNRMTSFMSLRRLSVVGIALLHS
ncbi:putative outer membrane lipoprotein Wza, partial [Vibrio parahaemolyticus EKP-021]